MVFRPRGEVMRRAWPVLLFAATLALFERAARGRWSWLPLWTLAVFVLAAAAMRLFPWRRVMNRLGPRPLVLYLLIVRHFACVLPGEAARVFRARSLCVTRRHGAGWFASLAWAAAAVLRRTVIRAERFYAALAVRGFE